MSPHRSLADLRIEAARGLVRIAERRALTRDEWDRVAAVHDQVEDSVRVRADIDEGAGLGVLSIESIAKREPVPPNAYGIRSAPSKSKPGTTYELRRFGGAWACECKGYRARRTCDHSRTEVQRDRAADEEGRRLLDGPRSAERLVSAAVYRRAQHAAHHQGMPGKGHDLESWDVVQSYRDPRPSDIPADAEKRHGYLDEAGRQHFVYVRTAPLTGTCVLCAARAS